MQKKICANELPSNTNGVHEENTELHRHKLVVEPCNKWPKLKEKFGVRKMRISIHV